MYSVFNDLLVDVFTSFGDGYSCSRCCRWADSAWY